MTFRPTRRARARRLVANAFEALVALLTIQTALVFLVSQDARAGSPLGQQIQGWAVAWSLAYGVSGVLVLAGLWRFDAKIELAGLSVLAAGLAINALAAAVVLGWTGSVQFGIYLAVMGACGSRAWSLIRGRDAYIVSHAEEFYGDRWTRR